MSEVDEEGELEQGQDRHQNAQQDAPNANAIAHAPSLDFVRKTWWDALLELYASAPYMDATASAQPLPELALAHAPGHRHGAGPGQAQLSAATRARTARQITTDLQFLFRTSNFWFAFINVPLFFSTLCDARARDANMQPALLLAALAMATFFRSSELGLGAAGRERALWLRERAQGALEASVCAGWVEPGLAQAAWVGGFLSLFAMDAWC